MNLKISKIGLNSFLVAFSFVLMENCFYLIDEDKFHIAFLNYSMLFTAVFLLIYGSVAFKYSKIIVKDNKYTFKTDIILLALLVLLSSARSFFLIDQPLGMGFSPQRDYFIILLAYFPLRFLSENGKINFEKVKNWLLIFGAISIVLYFIQVILTGRVSFIHAMQRKSDNRLYVDSFLCVIVGFIGLERYLTTNKLRYLSFTVLSVIYELFVTKGRLELAGFFLACLCVVFLKKTDTKKLILITCIGVALFVFINSSYADYVFDALNLIKGNEIAGIDTMNIRTIAHESFFDQLKQSFDNFLLGCGYPNIAFEATKYTAYIPVGNERTGLVDNGIFAFFYVYGALGFAVIIRLFFKLTKISFKSFKENNMCWPFCLVIFSIFISYNITFWWNKPSWTWGIVVAMVYLENINDEKMVNIKNEQERIF